MSNVQKLSNQMKLQAITKTISAHPVLNVPLHVVRLLLVPFLENQEKEIQNYVHKFEIPTE